MDDARSSPPAAARRTAAAWWLIVVLVLVLAVVVAGTVVGLDAVLPPATSRSGPASSTSPAVRDPAPIPAASRPPVGAPVLVRAGDGPLLPGAGSGVVYAQSATGIFRIELATGRVTRTPTPDLEEHVTFLAGPGWVLVKSRWSPTGVLVRDGRPAVPLPHRFDAEGFLHAGPGGRLWTQPEPSTDPAASTTLRLVGLDGRPAARTTLVAPGTAAPYALVPDGYGGVLLSGRGGVHRLVPGPSRSGGGARRISRGRLLAAGAHRVLVWDCGPGARCRTVVVDERTNRRTPRPAAGPTLLADGGAGVDPDGYGDVALSPDGTRLAVMGSGPGDAFRAHVVDLRDGGEAVLPGEGTDANANRQLCWSPSGRWLLALTDGRLRAYDTRTRTSRDIDLTGERLLHLTTVHQPGW